MFFERIMDRSDILTTADDRRQLTTGDILKNHRNGQKRDLMNILFMNSVGEDSWGGGERWMLTTGMGLRDRGHGVFYAGREESLFLERCLEKGFAALSLPIGSDVSLPNIHKLAGFISRHNISAVIANFNKDVRLAGLAAKISRRAIVIARNGLPILHNNWRYRLTYKWLVDGIITNTQSIKNRYLTYGWLNDDFIRVIHNGISPEIPESDDFETVISKYKLPRQRPVIGIFGRLVKQKQHTIFLEVAKNILQEWPEAIFLIVGDGPLRDSIRQYACELKIFDNIYMLGMQKEVMELYAFCDIVLLTSEEEGLPNAVLEAMLTGKPVVAFDVGGVGELIESERTGITVPPNDIFLMTQKTRELLLSPELRNAIGREAQAFVRKHFSLHKMIDEVETYLQELQLRKLGGKHGT